MAATALHSEQPDFSCNRRLPPADQIEIILYGYSFAEIINHTQGQTCFIDESCMPEFEQRSLDAQKDHPETWQAILWHFYSPATKQKAKLPFFSRFLQPQGW
ncbi:MAG: hypothetical protein WCZ66_06025 [Sphingomonadaceae bacterium]